MTASECLAALTAGVLHVSRQRSLTLIQKVWEVYFAVISAHAPLADCASRLLMHACTVDVGS